MKFILNENINVEIDSDGNELTAKQSSFFRNSKIRDKDNNLLVCYHGTTADNFSEFKNHLNFFSANKDYSKRYSKFDDNKILKCYLNIVNPFSLDNPKCKTIYTNEYIANGYAQGVSPYSTKEYINKYIQAGIDWVECDNLLEFLQENNYNEFDGIIVNEGGDLVDGKPIFRGNAYVAFYSNQIKLTTNINPTNSNDINK